MPTIRRRRGVARKRRSLARVPRPRWTTYGGRSNRTTANAHRWKYANANPPMAYPIGLMRSTFRAKLRYDTEVVLNPAADQVAAFVFRANGIYDPEYTGLGGHSAYMMEQYTNVYQKWRVVSSKITAWYISPTVTDAVPGYAIIQKSPDGLMFTTYSSTSHMLETQSRSNVKVVGPWAVASQLQANPNVIRQTYSQRKYYPGILDKDFEGNYTQDPTKQAFFELTGASMAGNNPPQMYFRVEIEYNVIFSEPIVAPQSGVTDAGLGHDDVAVLSQVSQGATGLMSGSGGATGPLGIYST